MRTITAPGVEIKEIDKSQYSPSMAGTTCYVMGFATKGEAYVPMEFTSRAAWSSYFGEPDTEAEKYFYNACTEVLNQNGRLYCARLPYDNDSFEKMVALKYKVDASAPISNIAPDYGFTDITEADNTIKYAAKITSTPNPTLISLDEVDEYKTNESQVAPNTFMIVDKTCGSYKRIQEDTRKGKDRELLGIVPVITTAANALYALKLITVDNKDAKYYESLGHCNVLEKQNAGIYAGSYKIETNEYNHDLVRQLNSCYKNYKYDLYSNINVDDYRQIVDIYNGIQDIIAKHNDHKDLTIGELDDECSTKISDWPDTINKLISALSAYWSSDPEMKQLLDTKPLNEIEITDADSLSQIATKVETLQQYYNSTPGWYPVDKDDTLPNTVSFEANEFFSSIQFNTDLSAFDRVNLKKIGVVIYKTYIDPAEGNKIAYEPVEAYVGSLYKDDKDINTGMTTFIDTIINNNSQYIYFFSNCFNSSARKKEYLGTAAENNIDILIYEPTLTTGILGFFQDQVKEVISIQKSIYDGMNKCFDKVSDINERDIDIIPDAGLANIASFIKSLGVEKSEYDLNMITNPEDDIPIPAVSMWKANSLNDAVKTWKAVEMKFDTFCKTRKDCMFIADGLRPMVIQGNNKIVRPSKPKNNIDKDILPYVKFVSGLNTNYGAGYIDWFEVADEFSGDFFWCPPSIKAMGVYIYTDSNFNYWDAPAGLNRGMVQAVDVAFSPTSKQAGAIYEKNWNYAINYPTDGIILEGQKTFQVKPSAFDRVNVRRLFLRLERQAYKVARYFVYEGNTTYTRQRLVDALDPYFKAAKVGGGVYDYKIICDESINTPTVIDNNELKVKIGIKPTKTAEFILIDFIAVSTGGSFEEAMA